jgi:poly(A) polymerase
MKHSAPLPDWLQRPIVRAVSTAFAESGRPLRFVGGAVRDHLLGLSVKDIDAATTATPDETLALLKRHRIKAVPTGIAHGTITAVQDGASMEITTLRRDVATDGRHAVVAFTDDWKVDASRRDFTLNALYLAPDGTLYDYFGGREDLARGHIRFIGEPAERIAEDYLRILRYFRFLATHGREPAEIGALAACEAAALELLNLSGERIRQEMLKLLAAPQPLAALEVMQISGVLAVVTGHAFALATLQPLLALETACGAAPHALVRLALLLRSTGQGTALAASIGTRWRLSGKELKLLQLLVAHASKEPLSAQLAHRLIYLHGQEWGPLLLLLNAAEQQAASHSFAPLWQMAGAWVPPRLPVTGEDLSTLGIAPGPALGKALRGLEQAWIESDFTLDRAALLLHLRA